VRRTVAILLVVTLGGATALHAADAPAPATGDERYVHAYVAQWSRTRFNQIVRGVIDYHDSWVGAAGVGGRWTDLGPHTRLEWELQAAKHWGEQDHAEVNALALLRWHRFPWDRVVRNTVALGTGPSYAFEVPAIEERGNDETTYLLQHLMLDVSVAPPGRSRWSLFLRVHHRSGVFGLVADSGSSNFVGGGVRLHLR